VGRNASPLILFSRIGRLDLVERLAPTILVPNAVIEEVRAGQYNVSYRLDSPP
jgi:predicted nucleic acid-binding protein